MREPFGHQAQMLFDVARGWGADIQPSALATFLTTDFDVHGLLWICRMRAYKFCLP